MPNTASDNLINDDLYRQIILDHYSRPRCNHRLEHPTCSVEGTNPSCGDEIELDLLVKDGVVQDVGFVGEGCSISMAAASMLAGAIKGQPVAKVRQLAQAFKARLLSHDDAQAAQEAQGVDIGELEALDGVRDYPVRIKCALLGCNTLLTALDEAQKD